MSDLWQKYPSFRSDISYAVDRMYEDALERIYTNWEKADPKPSVEETRQIISFYDDGLADAWVEYMEDYEGDDEPDPPEAPSLAAAVEWLVREYDSEVSDEFFEEVDLERGRHKRVDTSDVMIEAILYRQDRNLAEGWTDWLRKNR